jgi:DNA-binding transcriptional LysR family regulator
MEIRQLEALSAIAETGSFHSAAERLRLTQSAVSHQIKSLEAELREELIVRAKPRVHLSEAGQLVLQSAERILAEIDELRQRFAPAERGKVQGTLRVAASTLGIVYLYGELLESFIAHYPGIELIVTAVQTSIEGVRQVVSRTADVAFGALPIDFGKLEMLTLGNAEHVVIVRPNHPLAQLREVSADELRKYHFVRYQPGAGSRYITDQVFLQSGGYPPVAMESNDTEFIKRIVGLGVGVAVVPAFTVAAELREGRFRMLRIGGFDMHQDFCLVHRKGHRLRTLETFRRFMLEHRHGELAASAEATPPQSAR